MALLNRRRLVRDRGGSDVQSRVSIKTREASVNTGAAVYARITEVDTTDR